MLRRKDSVHHSRPPLPPNDHSTNRMASVAGVGYHEFGCPSSKRIKTEPCYDENISSIDMRLAEIKNKYQKRDSSRPLSELNENGFRNINHIRIKEVDSPISCLKRSSLQNNYFTAKDYRQQQSRPQNPEHFQYQTKDNSRTDNIDTINQKIRNILKTIEGSEQ
mgnify:CR=1 FL=1